jgi:hypothetical protein
MAKGFKAVLHIEEDPDLRDHIKDTVKGYFRSITKEDLTSMVEEVLQKHSFAYGAKYVQDTVKASIDRILGYGYADQVSAIRAMIRKEITDVTREEIVNLVKTIPQEELDKLIKQVVTDTVNKRFTKIME